MGPRGPNDKVAVHVSRPAVTTFFLIRHGDNDLVGHRIAGRTPGVHLNTRGQAQARQLADSLGRFSIQHIYSSPLERAVETAEPLARKLELPIQTSANLVEIDFGEWNGRVISELDAIEAWRKWNSFRSASRTPNGESMIEVQGRMVQEVERLRRRHPGSTVALFSHGDPLRSVIVHDLGVPLDLLLRLEISPASVTCFTIDDWSVRFQFINSTFS